MFQLLETFISVYENNNFTKAASELSISQPTISVHIEKLETEIDVVLFERSNNKKITPTLAAHFLYEKTKQMQSSWDNVLGELASLSHGKNQSFKIGASPIIGNCLIPKILGNLQKAFPKIDFEIIVNNSEHIFQSVSMLETDIGLVESPLVFPNIDRQEFMLDKLVLLGNPQNKTWLLREEGSGIREYSDRYMMEHNILPEDKLVINSNEVILQLVELGYGRTLQSELVNYSNSVETEETTLIRPLYAISNKNHPDLDKKIIQGILNSFNIPKK
ncbi:LysR family transcriptional regulator [Listeria grandensis]|uniref:LysR family transcriptional regulator n=1 Tax=Listeria grandensis TaxID=1494963 RepID=A0A7X0Y6C7_9LIST|nr:LysR family transcriptional regulator [Listeria grandensis]MBC1474454.1 LysR family transcriptional regulator [Listeria grandensis]MBC1937836.1 LysR family transcriptional regulator [Listeria grandensis]